MKKLIFILCMVWIVTLAMPISASNVYVTDNAELLFEDAVNKLEDTASDLSSQMGVNFVILTENGIGGQNPYIYAADYYDYGGYSQDGVILLLDMAERDWCIVTSGECIYSLNDSEIDRIGEKMVPYLSKGQYESGFKVFLEESAYWMGVSDVADDGIYNENEYISHTPSVEYQKDISLPQCIGIGCGIGVFVALIVCLVMKSQMNTAKPQFAAEYYMVENSFDLLRERDRFLYSNITKVPRPKDESRSGGNRGGSSSFRGSSGRSHGGGGGKF